MPVISLPPMTISAAKVPIDVMAPKAPDVSAVLVSCPPPAALEWSCVALANEAIVGVTSVGDVPKTKAPEPVSSDITPSNCKDVVAANTERLSV